MRKTRSQIINQVRLSLLLIRPSPTPISENRTHQPATQQHTNNTNNRHPQSRRHTPTRQYVIDTDRGSWMRAQNARTVLMPGPLTGSCDAVGP